LNLQAITKVLCILYLCILSISFPRISWSYAISIFGNGIS